MFARIAAAVLVALCFVSFDAPRAEAKECKSHLISGLGAWKGNFGSARASARYAWKREAKKRYGWQYNKWWLAKDRSYGCWTHKKRERCRVKARPCRLGN